MYSLAGGVESEGGSPLVHVGHPLILSKPWSRRTEESAIDRFRGVRKPFANSASSALAYSRI